MRVQRALLERILRREPRHDIRASVRIRRNRQLRGRCAPFPSAIRGAATVFIDAEIESGESALTERRPRQYVRTSGSTGRPKDIPLVPPRTSGRASASIQTVGRVSVPDLPRGLCGSILAIVSPAAEGCAANGKSFGAASGIVAGDTPRLVQEKFVIPAEVLTIADAASNIC